MERYERLVFKEQKMEYLELVPDHSMENDHVEIIANVQN